MKPSAIDGRVCTSKDVAACSKSATDCETLKGNTRRYFDNNFPDVFGKVCVEPSGEQCVRTNVDYTTCKAPSGKYYSSVISRALLIREHVILLSLHLYYSGNGCSDLHSTQGW